MQSVRIEHFHTTESFKYLWLKYVTGFDLEEHCAKCLLGHYSERVNAGTNHVSCIVLDEHSYRYIYLCGVTTPYVWKNNLHLALEYAEGETFEYNDGRTQFTVVNARRIEIKGRREYPLHHCGDQWVYHTCRNWRFAYQETFKTK